MEITIIAFATLVTFGRVLLLMLVAILSGWILGYVAIKNRVFENGNVIFIRGRTFHIGSVASALSRYVNAPV